VGRRVAGIAGENDIVGSERLAVVPGDAALELPGHHLAVGRQAAVLRRRHFGGQHREQVAVRIPAGERLIEDAAALLLLGAGGPVRAEVHWALPPQHLECPAAAALGGLVRDDRLRLRDAGVHQHHRGHRGGKPQTHHVLDERTTRQAPLAHVLDQSTQLCFLHAQAPREDDPPDQGLPG
jgi:hypothetical protein